MTATPDTPETPDMTEMIETISDDTVSPRSGRLRWAGVWQAPVLLLGLVLFVLGIMMGIPASQPNEFPQKLDEIETYLKANNLAAAEEALKVINEHLDLATTAQQALHWQLWGDLVYLQQRDSDLDAPRNHQAVLDYYNRAESLGLSLDDLHLKRMADSLVGLDRIDDAFVVLELMNDAPGHRRYQVLKEVINRRLGQPGVSIADLGELLERFTIEVRKETDAPLRRQETLWAASLQARGLIESGNPQRAIDYLNPRWIRYNAEGGDADLAPLAVLFGKAYQMIGEGAEAERWYIITNRKLAPSDALRAEALVGLAQLKLAESNEPNSVRQALDLFTQAESNYPGTRGHLEALIGRADCEARLEAFPQSIEHFAEAVKIMAARNDPTDPRLRKLTDIVRDHYDLNYERGSYDRALDFLTLLPPLYPEQMPAELLVGFAVTHEQLAQQLTDKAEQIRDANGLVKGLSAADRKIRRANLEQAAVHYGLAAAYYEQHAEAVTIADADAHALSLWQSALCYDKANLPREAIRIYEQYRRTLPQDGKYLEALQRMGMAYQADKQYSAAADVFSQLIEGNPNELMAYNSYVPLARCYAALGEYDQARRVLEEVLTNHPGIRPGSVQYRDALIELGKLFYQQGEFEKAVTQFSEAAHPDRYGDQDAGPMLKFYLADSYRRSVAQLDEQLQQVLPQSKEQAFRKARVERLNKAQQAYGQVVEELEKRDWETLEPVEQLYLRNSYFYRGDCAYELGNWTNAIALYDEAAKRWEREPASLVALVQIVNAYCELGDIAAAKVANDRARWQLKRIPDEAFDDPNLPMSREHWQDWLRWTSEHDLFDARASAVPTP